MTDLIILMTIVMVSDLWRYDTPHRQGLTNDTYAGVQLLVK
jgi:hypothetical protein